MRAPSVLALGLLLALSACAAAGPTNPAPVAVSPPNGHGPDEVLVPVPTSEDPRVVRCGIDDRPRSVVGMRASPVDAPVDAPLAVPDRALLGDRIAMPETRAASPMPTRRPPPPPDPPVRTAEEPPAVPPRTDVHLRVEAARPVEGRTLSSAMVSALMASRLPVDACEDLLDASDEGRHPLELTLSSTGAVTEVRTPERAGPSKLVRCAMERACQVRGISGEPTVVMIPVVVERDRPIEVATPPPIPPPPPQPPTPVRVTLTGAGVTLRAPITAAAASCHPEPSSARVHVRLEISRDQTRSLTVSGPSAKELVGCLLQRLDPSRRLATPVTVDVIWNP